MFCLDRTHTSQHQSKVQPLKIMYVLDKIDFLSHHAKLVWPRDDKNSRYLVYACAVWIVSA